jgi:hypothetical protein
MLRRVRTCPLPHRPAIRSSLLIIVAAATTSAGLAGCQRALLPPQDDRTQFDAYDRRRYKLPPRTVIDPFGHEQPNLRGRLNPER